MHKTGLRKKIILTILSVGVLSVTIGLITTAWQGTAALREALGDNFEGLAQETAQKVDLAMTREVAELRPVRSSDVILSAVLESNHRLDGLPEEEVARRIQESATLEKAKQLSNNASAFLKETIRISEKDGTQLSSVVVDKRGLLVAGTNASLPYRFDREGWWRTVLRMQNDTVFLSNVYQEKTTDRFVFDLAIPIYNPASAEIIGAIKITFDLKGFLSPLIIKTRFGNTGHAMLIDSDGTVLACPILPTGMHIPQGELVRLVTAMEQGWVIAEDDGHGGKDSIVGFSPVEGVIRIAGLAGGNRWHSFIRQAPEETYAPIDSLLRAILAAGGLSIGFLAIIGFFASKKLVEPIHLLHLGAEEIGKGALNHRLNIRTGDEIEQLAEEFNQMAEKLNASYTNLEDQVRDRTMELRETVEQLQEMDRLKSEFLSNMSHELRTPLTSIIGFSEILLDKVSGGLNETQTRYVQNMSNSGHDLLEIIGNILDLSKIRSGKMQINARPCQIDEVIDAARATVMPLIKKKGLHLEREIDDALPVIFADEGKVRQILLNLLSNAVKFTAETGTIAIRGRLVSVEGTASVEISVADTGMGIRQNDLEMIFSEFRQVDASYTRDNPGTGLGLPITKHFVEMHGGKIWVESMPGRGSTFTFSLPLRTTVIEGLEPAVEAEGVASEKTERISSKMPRTTEQVADPDLSAVQTSEESESPTILVVEDDRAASELIRIYLEREGYKVVTAYDGAEAVEKARLLLPFAITLDIMLPKKDGWQVLQELQSFPETMNIPIIILSMVDDPETGFSLGAVDYLLKPLDKEALLKSLSKLSLVERSQLKPVTILLIEPDREVAQSITAILEETAFGLILATDIEQGVLLALEAQPDIILSGIGGFPDQSSLDLPKKMARYRTIKDIPVIVYLHGELTLEVQEQLEGEIRKILHFDGGSIKEALLSEIKKYEKLYPDKARMIDGLTGLFNERYMKSRLSDEVERAFRYKRTFSLVVSNVDAFKAYNERNGVENGNKVLSDIANIFKENLRLADVVFRIGGSTLLVLMTETIQRPSILVAEKLRRLVESHLFPSHDPQSGEHLTISIGVSTFFKDAKTSEMIIGKAFDALEKAKASGGNCVLGSTTMDGEGSEQ